jgi:SEC-C motif-containing protein
MSACPCGSDKPFAACCEPFLTFKDKPKSVRQLVRARFCAYKLGAGTYRDFLVRTWHPAAHGRINPTDLTNDAYVEWKALDILLAQQQGDQGGVEFKATYSERGGPDKIHHERSLFVRVKGVWYYVEGAVKTEDVATKEDA